MFARKHLPPDLTTPYAAFTSQAERVESARTALLSCLPVGRVDPVPVPVGLDLVVDELRSVEVDLGRWRVDAVEDHWQHCRTAIADALEAVPEARRVAQTSGELEELLEAVGEVVEPLDAWGDAERHWLSLRRRRAR